MINASEMVGTLLKKGDIVVYESTVYPGATEEEMAPVLEKWSGLIFNKDFFLKNNLIQFAYIILGKIFNNNNSFDVRFVIIFNCFYNFGFYY
jgi:hypothetical protein